MKYKVVIDTITGDSMINEFMHAADVFENGKQIGFYEQVVITGETEVKIESLVDILKSAFEKVKKNVVFISIREINKKPVFNYKPYIRPNTQSISTGREWGMLKNILETIGYEVETDQYMNVKSAKLKLEPMKTYEIHWEDLNDEAKERLKDLYHENIELSPLTTIDIEDEEDDVEQDNTGKNVTN